MWPAQGGYGGGMGTTIPNNSVYIKTRKSTKIIPRLKLKPQQLQQITHRNIQVASHIVLNIFFCFISVCVQLAKRRERREEAEKGLAQAEETGEYMEKVCLFKLFSLYYFVLDVPYCSVFNCYVLSVDLQAMQKVWRNFPADWYAFAIFLFQSVYWNKKKLLKSKLI